MVARRTMPSVAAVVERMLRGGAERMGREHAGRDWHHRDPLRIAVHLLGCARRWSIALRLDMGRDPNNDEHDASMARRGIRGARELAVRLLDELRASGAITGENVDALLRRYRVPESCRLTKRRLPQQQHHEETDHEAGESGQQENVPQAPPGRAVAV